MDKQTLKRYAVSTSITFLSAFVLTALTVITQSNADTELLKASFWLSLSLAGFRSGAKALKEYIENKIHNNIVE